MRISRKVGLVVLLGAAIGVGSFCFQKYAMGQEKKSSNQLYAQAASKLEEKSGYSLEVPTGRSATYMVAASNAPAHVKAQADYVCDGTADDVEIQAAIDALHPAPFGSGKVQLSEGQFNLAAPVQIKSPATTLMGVGLATVLKPANGANCNGITMTPGIGTVIIEKMTLDGNKANNTAGRAIDFSDTYDMRFRDLHISSWKQNGLYSVNTARKCSIYIDAVLVYASGGDGVYIDGAAGIASAASASGTATRTSSQP